MSTRTATRLAWSLWALTLALAVATGVLGRLAGTDAYNDLGTLAVAWFAIQSYAMVGAIVASRRPENPIGWIFLAAPALMMTANTAGAYVELAVARSLPGAVPVLLGFGWTWALAIGLIASFLVLLFPEGRLPSPRWRPVLWFVVGWLAAVVVLFTFKPGPLDEPLGHVENPVGIPGFGTLEGVVFGVGGVIVLAASLAALVTRLRRGSGEERQQLKWVLAAVAVVLFIIIGVQAIATSLISGFGGIPDYGWLLTIALIPLAVGVAILRYHLYDLGRIVNRTVVYVLLSAALADLQRSHRWQRPRDRRVDARGRRTLPPCTESHPGSCRPPLLPGPLRRAADARGIHGPASRRGRPRGARHRAAVGRAGDDAAGTCLSLASSAV